MSVEFDESGEFNTTADQLFTPNDFDFSTPAPARKNTEGRWKRMPFSTKVATAATGALTTLLAVNAAAGDPLGLARLIPQTPPDDPSTWPTRIVEPIDRTPFPTSTRSLPATPVAPSRTPSPTKISPTPTIEVSPAPEATSTPLPEIFLPPPNQDSNAVSFQFNKDGLPQYGIQTDDGIVYYVDNFGFTASLANKASVPLNSLDWENVSSLMSGAGGTSEFKTVETKNNLYLALNKEVRGGITQEFIIMRYDKKAQQWQRQLVLAITPDEIARANQLGTGVQQDPQAYLDSLRVMRTFSLEAVIERNGQEYFVVDDYAGPTSTFGNQLWGDAYHYSGISDLIDLEYTNWLKEAEEAGRKLPEDTSSLSPEQWENFLKFFEAKISSETKELLFNTGSRDFLYPNPEWIKILKQQGIQSPKCLKDKGLLRIYGVGLVGNQARVGEMIFSPSGELINCYARTPIQGSFVQNGWNVPNWEFSEDDEKLNFNRNNTMSIYVNLLEAYKRLYKSTPRVNRDLEVLKLLVGSEGAFAEFRDSNGNLKSKPIVMSCLKGDNFSPLEGDMLIRYFLFTQSAQGQQSSVIKDRSYHQQLADAAVRMPSLQEPRLAPALAQKKKDVVSTIKILWGKFYQAKTPEQKKHYESALAQLGVDVKEELTAKQQRHWEEVGKTVLDGDEKA